MLVEDEFELIIPPQSTSEKIAEESQEEKEVSRGPGEEKTETSLLPATDSTIHPMPRARSINTGVWNVWSEQEYLSGFVPTLDTASLLSTILASTL